MPWQTAEYYDTQRRMLRPATFRRLHENRWTSPDSRFITPELWDQCVIPTLTKLLPSRDHELFVGVDVGVRHDAAAVVAVYRDGDHVVLASHRMWTPGRTAPLDLETTVETHLRELHDHYRVTTIFCDPYQCHRSIMTLQRAGLPIVEYPQTTAGTTRMGQTLFELLTGRNLRLYAADDLRTHALHTVASRSWWSFPTGRLRAAAQVEPLRLSIASLMGIDCSPCSAGSRVRLRSPGSGRPTRSTWRLAGLSGASMTSRRFRRTECDPVTSASGRWSRASATPFSRSSGLPR